MTSLGAWVHGARPRTLPAAVAPVLAGTGAAVFASSGLGDMVWPKALCALGVALTLQIGVNYANDYSDGIRGTDDDRIGPLRLVASGTASPQAVKRAAQLALVCGAVLGLILAATTSWWLLLIGAAALVAAWTYTGGPKPYGYLGLGEVMVFVFFGLVAVIGTTYVLIERVTWASVAAGTVIGALACAILVTNNLRDIPSDVVAGKRTLAVTLGAQRTRAFYVLLGVAAWLTVVASAVLASPWLLTGLIGVLPWLRAVRVVRNGEGRDLIAALQSTSVAELLTAVGLTVGFLIGA